MEIVLFAKIYVETKDFCKINSTIMQENAVKYAYFIG